MSEPLLVLVFASAKNHVIGADGGMPWHLPADLAHFKALTLGGTVLMGRRTCESLGVSPRPLPGRRNLVLTRDPNWSLPGFERVGSLDEAVASCAQPALFIIGGAQLYREALPRAARLEWTRIQAEIAGDTFFEPRTAAFRLQAEQRRRADERNAHELIFQTWVREGSVAT